MYKIATHTQADDKNTSPVVNNPVVAVAPTLEEINAQVETGGDTEAPAIPPPTEQIYEKQGLNTQAPTLEEINAQVETGVDTESPALPPPAQALEKQELKTQASSEEEAPKRLFAWTLFTVLSTIVLSANEKWSDRDDGSSDRRWVSAGTGITMIFGFASIVAHFAITAKYVGQIAEGGTTFLCTAFWFAILPVIMDADNEMGQDYFYEGIGTANVLFSHLYFASWGAFLTTLYIASSYVHERLVDKYSGMHLKTALWYCILLASFVLLWSSSVFFSDLDDFYDCSDTKDDDIKEICRRTGFAVFVGVLGTLLALPATVLSEMGHFHKKLDPATAMGRLHKKVEMVLVIALFVLYCFGLAIITFQDGPGQITNNVYFATCLGFLVLLFWVTEYISELWFGEKEEEAQEEEAQEEEAEC